MDTKNPVIPETESESCRELLAFVADCGWIDPAERDEILALAPYMTELERTQILQSLMMEDAMRCSEGLRTE